MLLEYIKKGQSALTTRELAEQLNISIVTARRLLKANRIEHFYVGSHPRITMDAVEKFVAENKTPSKATYIKCISTGDAIG